MNEVLVTHGANGGLHAFITALVNKDDEAVFFEPTFPMYLDHISIAGGVPKPVPLEYKDGMWRFDFDLLRKTLNAKTKLIILNNPHNPSGKCFTKEELE